MFEEDRSLATACRGSADLAEKAIGWIDDNRGLVRNEAEVLTAEIRRSIRQLRKLGAAAERKMCVGVFGPSQSGKSYLISALARGDDGNLLAEFGDARPDFVSEINPEGGKESTGLVTRFTMTRPPGLPQGYPVKLRLLSETDLVKILGNSYFEDFNHEDTPDSAALGKALDALASRQGVGVGGAPDADDLSDLHEYFRDNFRHCARVQMLESAYWVRAKELAPRLGIADRAQLFGLIWNGVTRFNELFARLQAALAQIDFAPEAFCPLSALIPREASIIDVATLAGLADESSSGGLDVVGSNGRRATLPRAQVTALTAEITVVMVNKPDDFFDYTDLLDFPGYRSRKKNTDIQRTLASGDALEELFLRGKVAYLFERYCAERELTSMLLCIGPGPAEVQTLPKVIDAWVRATHGDTVDRRADVPTTLFFVMTKFDMEFVKKKGAAQSEESRWNTRIEASLTSYFGGIGDWVEHWRQGKAFDNVYWVRNPNVRAEALFQYDAEGRELALRAEQEAYVGELKTGFLRSSLVTRHVADCEEAWNAAMSLNDGGIGYLRQRLRPLCNPDLKRRQIQGSLAEERRRLSGRLALYFRSDDKEQERKVKNELARTIAGRLAANSQAQRFGRLLRALQIADHELYDLFFRVDDFEFDVEDGGGAVSAAPAPTIVGTGFSAVDLLGDIFGAAAPVLEEETCDDTAKAKKPPKDAAAIRAAEVEKFWIDRMTSLAENQHMQAFFGIPPQEFGSFIHELAVGAARLGVDAKIEEEIRIASRFRNIKRDKLVWKQASRASVAINSYVDWLGFDPRQVPPERRRVSIGGRELAVFQPHPEVGGFPVVAEDQAAYDVQYYRDWIASLVALIGGNVDFEGGLTFDPAQNRILGDILAGMA
ncbi:MAG: type III effector HopL1 [Rhodospirillaceae bacterium]|nr:type III effector HopL1 [Rhodospirillales bacterium]